MSYMSYMIYIIYIYHMHIYHIYVYIFIYIYISRKKVFEKAEHNMSKHKKTSFLFISLT